MKNNDFHKMLTEQEALAIQQKLRQRVVLSDNLPAAISIIAGVDVEYDKESDTIAGADNSIC